MNNKHRQHDRLNLYQMPWAIAVTLIWKPWKCTKCHKGCIHLKLGNSYIYICKIIYYVNYIDGVLNREMPPRGNFQKIEDLFFGSGWDFFWKKIEWTTNLAEYWTLWHFCNSELVNANTRNYINLGLFWGAWRIFPVHAL